MRLLLLALIVFLYVSPIDAQTAQRISGVVVDAAGGVVADADVTLRSAGQVYRTHTGEDGSFTFDVTDAAPVTIEVSAVGFEPTSVEVISPSTAITITLSPRSIAEQVAVLRTAARIDQTAASVVALGADELAATAALTVDDRLRQVPGFTLFRRAGSRTANPTTQGVSLRGIGASGASRALVLADGRPLNDPFGGWVYWGRVPAESISQVEVLRGPAGDLYGSSAIGGVVSIVTRRPGTHPAASLEASYGNQQTPSLSFFASIAGSKWAGSIAGEHLHTDGFIPVATEERGAVDTNAGVRRSVIVPELERRLSEDDRFFASAEFFVERRTNGTFLQNNDTSLRNFTAGIDWSFRKAGTMALRVDGGTQSYDQTFSAIAIDRETESLTRVQNVPSQVFGSSGQWTGKIERAIIFAGFDGRAIRGRSDETGFANAAAVSLSDSGGREFSSGLFAGSVVALSSRLTVSGSLRYDRWQNYRGYSVIRSLITGTVTTSEFADRTESSINPRVSALYRIAPSISVSGTIASGFRRPTLNELYRNFRVGDVLTLANPDLGAERAIGGDGAVLMDGFGRKLFVRAAVFCTDVSRNVSNVTLSVTPALITRQRQNVGRTRSCGVETDGQFRASDEFRISGGYLFVDGRILSFPANADLEGRRIPQVARHQFTAQAEYANLRLVTISLQLRAIGPQFDDDQNMLRLAGFATVDAFVSRQLGKSSSIFGAVENLFDTRVESGRTPVLSVASRRTFRLGVRLRFGRN